MPLFECKSDSQLLKTKFLTAHSNFGSQISKKIIFSFQPLDIEFIKSLHNRVNIVPVIAKADTLTKKEISRLKKRILDEIAKHNIKIYQLPDVEEDEEEDYKEQTRVLKVHFYSS